MPTYVIEYGQFARIEGGDARGKGGNLVVRKRGDLIELTPEQAAEKRNSVRPATEAEIAANRALSMEMNPLPLPSGDAQEGAQPASPLPQSAPPEPEPPAAEPPAPPEQAPQPTSAEPPAAPPAAPAAPLRGGDAPATPKAPAAKARKTTSGPKTRKK